jgi:hypothetical protein
MTITEALAEIKTVQARIVKKRASIGQYVARQDGLKDPLASESGGSAGFIAREMQAIADLESRIVALRAAIQTVNHATTITAGDVTKTLADWLTWRREVLPGREAFYTQLRNQLQQVRAQCAQKQMTVVPVGQSASTLQDVLVNIDEKALADEIERLETIKGGLDGQLSLKNATTNVVV